MRKLLLTKTLNPNYKVTFLGLRLQRHGTTVPVYHIGTSILVNNGIRGVKGGGGEVKRYFPVPASSALFSSLDPNVPLILTL